MRKLPNAAAAGSRTSSRASIMMNRGFPNPPVQNPPAKAAQPAQRLETISLDVAQMIDHVAAAAAWDRYRRGETNAFSRRIYVGRGPQTFDEIRRRYRLDPEFRATVDRYVQEFERLLPASVKMRPAKPLPRHISCRRLARFTPCSRMRRQTGLNRVIFALRETVSASTETLTVLDFELFSQSSGVAARIPAACKPGFVWRAVSRARDGHSSGTAVAGRLEQPTRATIRRRI